MVFEFVEDFSILSGLERSLDEVFAGPAVGLLGKLSPLTATGLDYCILVAAFGELHSKIVLCIIGNTG